MSDSICRNCGGLIMEPGKSYGWAGKTCHCPVHPSRQYQDPATDPLRIVPMFADPQDLERWTRAQRPLDLKRLVDTQIAPGCGCIGPQNGQPLCPCQMRGVTIQNGRYVRIQDLGPAPGA